MRWVGTDQRRDGEQIASTACATEGKLHILDRRRGSGCVLFLRHNSSVAPFFCRSFPFILPLRATAALLRASQARVELDRDRNQGSVSDASSCTTLGNYTLGVNRAIRYCFAGRACRSDALSSLSSLPLSFGLQSFFLESFFRPTYFSFLLSAVFRIFSFFNSRACCDH